MGNCQAAEAATVVIQHTCGRVERLFRSVSAGAVMAANPGHYVAAVTSRSAASSGELVRSLNLLRPQDTLLIGHVYRLVTFEEVLKEFAAKKHVKMGCLLASKEGIDEVEEEEREEVENRKSRKLAQWRPALHSISEL